MKRLLFLGLFGFGCASAMPPTAAQRPAEPPSPLETSARVSPRIGPLAALGSGVRRVDAERR